MTEVRIYKLSERPAWARSKPGPKPKYPFDTMGVGEVALIPVDAPRCASLRSLRAIAHTRGKQLGRKFKCRELEDGCYEIWREC